MSSNQWSSLKVSPELLEVIDKKLGFPTMTPVQQACIPLFLQHKDVTVQAVTGSGKTLAFLLPAFEMLLRRREKLLKYEVGALILSPTRELAVQIDGVAQLFMPYLPSLTKFLCIGGSHMDADLNAWESTGGHVVIATPGRLEHMMKDVRSFNVKSLEILVLDEADRLLSLGFERSVLAIIGKLPKQRRTGLFSATQTAEVNELCKAGLRNPVGINIKVHSSKNGKVKEQALPTTLHNYYHILPYAEKLGFLVNFLHEHPKSKFIVFVLTCAAVDYWVKVLPQLSCVDVPILGLHGKMKNKKRVGTYKTFVDMPRGVLFCTDVAARGVDIPDVDWIIQFEAPQDPDYFVHRVGRTARAGRSGKAVVLLDETEDTYVNFLQVRKVDIAPLTVSDQAKDYKEADSEKLLAEVKALAVADRDIMEHGQNAVVSFFRAYKEHKCNFVFMYRKCPFAEVARGYGLLFMPILGDLKHLKIEYQNWEGKASDIKYKDPRREKARLLRLESDKKKKEETKARREKRREKKETLIKNQSKKKKKRKQMDEETFDDLAYEAKMMKKLKKGKITQKEFDDAMDDDFD